MKQLILIVTEKKWNRLKKPGFLQKAAYHRKGETIALVWEGDAVADEFHTWWESTKVDCSEFFVLSHNGTEDSEETYGCFHDHPFELFKTMTVLVK
jgi:hypothetical protein